MPSLGSINSGDRLNELGFVNNQKKTLPINENPLLKNDLESDIPIPDAFQKLPSTQPDQLEDVVGTGGARIQTFPTKNIGLRAQDNDGDSVFQVILDGDNAGDVIMGDNTTNKFAIWDASKQKLIINGIDPAVNGFGGDGSDGILNVTSGTTNIAIQKWQYTSITVASGATLSTNGVSGIMELMCQEDMIVTGLIDFSGKITSKTVQPAFNLIGGDTFTPTGKYNGHGAGGGGGSGVSGTGGAGGAGDGGGAGGNGGAGGGTAGAGGASTGGGVTQGAGGDAADGGTAGAGGNSAGGGGNGSAQGGGGGGNPGGSGLSGGSDGGDGFGADGGAATSGNGAGGGGAGGKGGYGGVDTLINVGGEFDGTSGTIDTSGGDATDGGDGGNGQLGSGGGGGGGDGGDGGVIRLIWGIAYSAPTLDYGGGSLGSGGLGGSGGASGANGSIGSAGSASSSTIKQIENQY